MVSARVLVNQTARGLSRKLVARARWINALKLHVFVALCCWRREASDWPPGPGPLRRPHSGLVHWGRVIVYKCSCMHAQARDTKRPFVSKLRARARICVIYVCVGIKRALYYGSKWRGFVFSGRGKIMATTRRHVYVRFQELKYEEAFAAFLRARGVGSFGARCYLFFYSLWLVHIFFSNCMKLHVFPLMHKAFNAFCVVFIMHCIILYNKPNAQPFIGANMCVALISSHSSCRSHLQI